MAITYIKRVTGSEFSLVQINTSDTTATALGANYITAQAANIAAINFSEVSNPFDWLVGDLVLLVASDGTSLATINSTFTTLTAIAGFGAGSVTLTGASVSGDFPVFNSTTGGVVNSGTLASNIMYKNISNVMAAGANVITDKATGTATAGAVTINKQSGVITTVALTTASGAAATITLTNSQIAATSVLLCQIQGGTNTTPGITIIATPGAGTATILLENSGVAAAALNGTVIFSFVVL